MKISSADVLPGKCFLSGAAEPQVVRVIAVQDGLVRYETKGRRKTWTGGRESPLAKFATELLKEVGSDYLPPSRGGRPRG